jgi:hypothetical protein
MYTIVKANRRQFSRQPTNPCIKFMALMAASVPLGYIYYVIDCLVRGG